MHKFTKIAVSILLILSMILNPLASVFDIRAGAVATAAGFGGFIVEFIIDQIVFQVGNQMWQTSINDPEGVYSTAKLAAFSNYENFITATDIVQVEYDIYPDEFGNPAGSYKPTRFYLDPTVILNDEQRESYQLIVDTCNDYLASGGDSDLVCYNIGGAYGFDPIGYEKVKEGIANKLIQNSVDEGVIDMVGNGVLPQYDFSFVGPQPSISAPVINGSAPLMKDGFEYTVPTSMILLERDGKYYYYYSSEESAKAAGCDYVQKWAVDSETGTEYWIGNISKTAYGAGLYVLYNGEIYYKSASGFVASGSSFNVGVSNNTIDNFSSFKSLDGTLLSSVYNGGDFKVGAVFNTTGAVQSTIPTVSVSEGEFTHQIGGGSVDIPRSEIEDIIGRAMELGLAVPDSWIQFAEDGSIQSVDGIELSKLQELIDAVKAGNLGFENMQEYLDLITKLIGAGNLTATQQKTILDNINAKSVAISEDISAIREAIESMVAEDEEVVANNDFDIDTPDSIIDKFPFCLPFDIYTVFNLLSSPPVAPQFEIPFEMEGYFEYSIDVDLSEFEMIASIVRWFLYIIFIIGLILVTNKLIGRG